MLRKISAYAAAGKEPEEESEEDTARSPEPWMLPGELDQARALHGQGCAGPGDGPMFPAMWHRDAGCHKDSPRSLSKFPLMFGEKGLSFRSAQDTTLGGTRRKQK